MLQQKDINIDDPLDCTQRKRLKPHLQLIKNLEEPSEYEKDGEQAFEQLFMYIRNYFLPYPNVLTLRDLTSKLEESLKSSSIAQVKASTKKHILKVGERVHWITPLHI